MMRFKTLTATFATVATLGGGTGVTLAVTGNGNSKKSGSNAAVTQYKPGKGCGDKNHVHVRENECKKAPK